MATTYKYLDYAGLQKFAKIINDKFTVINGKLDAVSAIVATDITWDKLLA